ncbi:MULTISPECIES: helix-turn-helix domain-containing protein [unclassified Streptomyces]|uniref:helix-turn-helix domain-containing protein n=1 Tax=unclassified Streptomyces TaxID=2593676 RepID=UPI002E290BE4|nr:helix-turn-helix domain-containing protein [Streptomyces sp. NBC_01422]
MVTVLDVRTAEIAPVLYRIPEAVQALGLSRSVVYDLIRAGRLRTVKEGRTRLVPASAIAEYVALLEREAGAAR